jgi:hypothetical protein
LEEFIKKNGRKVSLIYHSVNLTAFDNKKFLEKVRLIAEDGCKHVIDNPLTNLPFRGRESARMFAENIG